MLFEHDSMIMFPILGAVDECNHATIHMLSELLDSFRVVLEFQKVTISKPDPL